MYTTNSRCPADIPSETQVAAEDGSLELSCFSPLTNIRGRTRGRFVTREVGFVKSPPGSFTSIDMEAGLDGHCFRSETRAVCKRTR